jgi:hypothetical protein
MALVAGGGASLPRLLRAPAVILQLAALVPFGGRTALLVALVMLALWTVPRAARLLLGGRMPLLAVAVVAAAAPIAVLAIGAFATGGFFNVVLDRFTDDGGSAQTRLEMFEIFGHLSCGTSSSGASPISSIPFAELMAWNGAWKIRSFACC